MTQGPIMLDFKTIGTIDVMVFEDILKMNISETTGTIHEIVSKYNRSNFEKWNKVGFNVGKKF